MVAFGEADAVGSHRANLQSEMKMYYTGTESEHRSVFSRKSVIVHLVHYFGSLA
jgi:hypothetical protein